MPEPTIIEFEKTNVGDVTILRRTYGALFFSCFGSCWLLLSAYAYEVFNTPEIVSILLGALLFAAYGISLRRRAKSAGIKDPGDEQRRRDGRTFGFINAVQWVAIFVAFNLSQKLGHPDLGYPAALFVVGVHFFFMPPTYRYRANVVTGCTMVFWSILCPLLLRGDRMIAVVAFGAGVTLWLSAAWALRFASRRLRTAQGYMA